MPRRAKGFILSLDAAFAMTVIIIAGASISFFYSTAGLDSSVRLNTYTIGSDFLLVLQKSGKLESYVDKPEQTVNDDLQAQLQALPPQFCGNVTLFVYDDGGTFDLTDRYSSSSSCALPKKDVTRVKRIFLNFDREKFGLAQMDVWLR